jgi:hypothetical protein
VDRDEGSSVNAGLTPALRLGSEPAYPCKEHEATRSVPLAHLGLSKREHFAALALQGMLSADVVVDRTLADKAGWAATAVQFADALLEELAK